MRTISIYLRMTDHGTIEVTSQNKPKGERSFIIRNQPVTLNIGIFRHEKAVAVMTKAELEAEGWKTWLLNISKNHTLMFPVYIQPDYDYENPPITVSNEGFISVVLQHTDTEESAKAIEGMPGDLWEAELTGFGEDDTALETPLAILQWPIGYINRVADENADAPGLLESTYYTKEQVNELLRSIGYDGGAQWGHIVGTLADQEDLIALLDEKANKATTLAGYGITDAYTKTEIDNKVASIYRYKGSVNAYSDLPSEGQQVGDVYNVVTADTTHGIKAGDNVAWNGTAWDALAGEIDLSGYIQTSEKDSPNGVAGLDANGKVKTGQLPSLDFIPNNEKGANNGVATLDATGKVPSSQLPTIPASPLVLSAAPTTSTVGSVGQLATWHDANAEDQSKADHIYHLVFISTSENATLYHWEECVLLDSNGKVPSEQLPTATSSQQGAVKTNTTYGTYMNFGYVAISSASNNDINDRDGNAVRYSYVPIVPKMLDYAVRSVLDNVTVIPAATTAYTLLDASATTNNHGKVYCHTPKAASVYTLPSVSDDGLLHEIVLSVKFDGYYRSANDDGMHYYAWKNAANSLLYTSTSSPTAGTTVAYTDTALTESAGTIALYDSTAGSICMAATCVFQNSAGATLVPLPLNGDIEAGSVVTFLCRYNPLLAEWVIYPVMDGKEAVA